MDPCQHKTQKPTSPQQQQCQQRSNYSNGGNMIGGPNPPPTPHLTIQKLYLLNLKNDQKYPPKPKIMTKTPSKPKK